MNASQSTDWIEWKGGERPVSEDAVVETKYRDGKTIRHEARYLNWRNSGLVSYRVVQS